MPIPIVSLPCWKPKFPTLPIFYCGGVFKLERLILQLLLAKPSTDAEVKALAEGSIDEFAAWRVEARAENQLLLCDYAGRTRSWLMSLPVRTQAGAHTRLYFGSAVVPRQRHQTGKPGLGMAFNLLLGFHKLYSRVLLAAARKRLGRMGLR